MLQPITICSIDHRRPSASRERDEFSVAAIEVRIDQLARTIDEFPLLCLGQIDASDPPWRAVQNLEIETIADAGLSARIEMAMVLSLNFSSHIDKHTSSLQNITKKFDRLDATVGRRNSFIFWAATAVCDDRNIGVDDIIRHSAAFTFVRLRRASSASAASLNASPMNFSGQFLILPRRSTSSGTSVDTPRGASQKYSSTSSDERAPSAILLWRRKSRCSE
jgi:hypothetical protein